MAEAEMSPVPTAAPVTIKKYANRRLYNTATSSYVTLDTLCQMVKDGVDFVVFDAKTGEDITRQVLTQIIVEEEGKGQNLLPISFMRKLISFYGRQYAMGAAELSRPFDAVVQPQPGTDARIFLDHDGRGCFRSVP